ncbi:MAG TPA: hypothetical protein VFF11_09125 [Candidatus Binatia bacterium]|nr:hypothetical protein [Candidatus Binatia bacterium]
MLIVILKTLNKSEDEHEDDEEKNFSRAFFKQALKNRSFLCGSVAPHTEVVGAHVSRLYATGCYVSLVL